MFKKFKDKPAGLLSHSDLRTVKGQTVHWIFVAILFVFSLIAIVPTIWVVMTAFKDTQEIYSGFTFFPQDMSWNRIVTRISESWAILRLGGTIVDTLFKSIGDVAFTLVFCGFAGYALSKLKPIGHKVVFTLVVWTMMMPTQIRMVPNYMTMLHFPFAYDWGGVNLLNTYWPLWLNQACASYTIILFKNNFDALSTSYVEAARIDGCSDAGIFFRIMLPLSVPIVMYVSIGALQVAWADYFNPLIYLTDNITLPLKLLRMKNDPTVRMNTYFMGLIFGTIPPLIIFLICQRHILGGITVGGVKG
ncbi:MAG: carbohydrate ABC transporter permease [Clostridia bacterium]|nr:carbohydrate ABC transporter permease [Clostridia bacterium]